MEASPGNPGPVNMGNPEEVTIRDLAELVIALTGSSSMLVFAPLPSNDPIKRRPDVDIAKQMFGWRPNVRLEEGLVKTIEYFDRVLSAYEPLSVQQRSCALRRRHSVL